MTDQQPFDLISGFEISAIDETDPDGRLSNEAVAGALSATFGLVIQPHEVERVEGTLDTFRVPLTRDIADQLVENGFWGVETIIGDTVVSIEVEWPDGGDKHW